VHLYCLKKYKSITPQPEIELSVQMREASVTTPDRRQTPRTKLVEIAYLGLGPENGGLVLDVSDGGLSFHAVVPVQPAQTINFLLSLRGHSRIEGAGEVVWTNEMRTVCGLRFTSLSGDAREQLANWTSQSRIAVAAPEKTLSSLPPAEPSAPDASAIATDSESVFAIPPVDKFYLPEPMARNPWQVPLFFWILFGLLGAGLIVSAFIYGVHVGRSQVSSVTQSAAGPNSQASPQVPAPTPVPASTLATGEPSAETGAPATPSDALTTPTGAPAEAPKADNASASSVPRLGAEENSTALRDQHTEQPLQAGQSDLAAALAYLRGTNGPRDSSKAARLLWAAVGNGNSTAEVLLADLYLRGDGVARSCEQGRVLLKAASKSGNLEAEAKLKALNTKGCR
jgi:hypothetical protein